MSVVIWQDVEGPGDDAGDGRGVEAGGCGVTNQESEPMSERDYAAEAGRWLAQATLHRAANNKVPAEACEIAARCCEEMARFWPQGITGMTLSRILSPDAVGAAPTENDR